MEPIDGKEIDSALHASSVDSTSGKEGGKPRKFGKQCLRCNGYYVTDRFDERLCLWCENIEKGLDEPELSAIDPRVLPDELRDIRLVSQLRQE